MAVVAEVAGAALAVHVDILRQDLRYAVRTFGRARSFALTAILIVALGIGANTAAFSITDFVLLRPLPFPHADRLVTIWQRTQGYSHMELSPANYHDWRAGAQSFERMGAYTTMSATLSGSGEPERVDLAQFTSDVFPTLGIPAALGRYFSGGEDFTFQPDSIHGGEPLAVLSDGLWRSAFGADPGVLGRKIRLEGRPFTVIGVMPAGFGFPTRGTQLWIPYGVSAEDYQDRNNNYLSGLGRLKPGATLASARSEMALAAARSEQAYPKDNKDIGALVDTLHDELSDPARTMVLALSGAALCVLLIVCANLANLLLGRALGRRLELAVRTAMGAGRERLVRQLATESLLLAAVGGALGVFMAWLLVPLLWRLVPADFPTTASPGIDLRVLAFAGALTIATALLFGLAPVFPLMRTRATGVSALRDGTRTTGRKERLRGALVVAEVVASVVLLVVTGLLMRTLLNVQGRDPGFRPDGVLTLQTDLSASTYGDTARRTAFYTRVLDRVRALPGVGAAAYISGLPMVWGGGIWPVGLTGVELERRRDNTASLRFATPGFFGALAIPILRGRDVSDDDTLQTQMVAVVSESFVERYWPGEDAIGRRFNFGMADRTIVGVVGNIRMRGLERESEPQVYLPYRQQPDQALWGYVPKNLVVECRDAAGATRAGGAGDPPRHRSAAADHEGADPERHRSARHRLTRRSGTRAGGLRDRGVPARRDRPPRRARVRRVAADGGDRRPDRARRAAARHSGDGDAPRRPLGGRGGPGRAADRLRGRPLAAIAAGRRHSGGRADVRRHPGADGADGGRRHTPPDAAGLADRSRDGDSDRVRGVGRWSFSRWSFVVGRGSSVVRRSSLVVSRCVVGR